MCQYIFCFTNQPNKKYNIKGLYKRVLGMLNLSIQAIQEGRGSRKPFYRLFSLYKGVLKVAGQLTFMNNTWYGGTYKVYFVLYDYEQKHTLRPCTIPNLFLLCSLCTKCYYL